MPFFLYKKMKNVFTIDPTPPSIWTAAPKRVRKQKEKAHGGEEEKKPLTQVSSP